MPTFVRHSPTGNHDHLPRCLLQPLGVIVPTKVERVALHSAVSIAGLLLTTEAAIVEHKEK